MRLTSAAIFSLSLANSVLGKYFSEGWKPGMPVSQEYDPASIQTAATYNPTQSVAQPKSLFDISSYLESGPIKSLLDRAGINVTERLEAARKEAKIWDERIPLITDHNYKDLIVEEKFNSLEEERNRVWFLVITVTSAQPSGVSRYVDDQFDGAFNISQLNGDLPHVKWGRIDYMNVTALTTKWGVWRAPYLVVLQDRGQALRFYRPHQIRIKDDILHEFLQREVYLQQEPWTSAFGPGGKREFVLEWLAIALTKIYDVTVMVPRWLLIVVSGSIGSILINLLHGFGGKKNNQAQQPPAAVEPQAEQKAVESSPAPAAPEASRSNKAGGARHRKSKK